ncbi:MAG: hypothetical protein OCU22_05685 [Canidatus Methanoxibalbensis ujae]|nr:hypothetical protein [Candidatus Methanoxibalbensis ujae]
MLSRKFGICPSKATEAEPQEQLECGLLHNRLIEVANKAMKEDGTGGIHLSKLNRLRQEKLYKCIVYREVMRNVVL